MPRWRVKVSYTAVISKDEENQPVNTEEGAKHAARYVLTNAEHQQQQTSDIEAEVTAIEYDGKWFEAPPF